MFVQLTSHLPEIPSVWQAEPEAEAHPTRERPHLVRFALDELTVSVAVRKNAACGMVTNAEPVVMSSFVSQHPAARGLTVELASPALHACLEAIRDELGTGEIVAAPPELDRDPIVQSLGRALVAQHQVGQALSTLYANAICAALVTRLVALCRAGNGSGEVAFDTARTRSALPKWRLKRVKEYVEAHIGENIRLADMAGSAGLSRMHFAAQFRLATGLRPHEYLLRRRIERAQEMLRDPRTALVEVALGVGFQTQSHFTTVFKRFAGITPHRWRRLAIIGDRPRPDTRGDAGRSAGTVAATLQ
ncbi:MAG: helix-turn-helix domain-containing protein [Pseudomonadota bacterium]